MADEPKPVGDDDLGSLLRKQAAQRLLSYSQKQAEFSQRLLSAFTAHSGATTELLAHAVETGEFQPKLWLSNAMALSVEALGASLDVCMGLGDSPDAGASPKDVTNPLSIVFVKDSNAEVAGPVSLGLTADQLPTLAVTPIVAAGGGAVPSTLILVLTTQDDDVRVEIRGLKTAGVPLPLGFYTGLVTQTVGSTTTQIALVTLNRI